ncbi:Phosphate transporter family protein [Mariniphaga anaerophila]|uniref:Phosphate transporter n=1 Tax=Mariniphaga anaerophila TaxID=1484053 RepID=A0A1M5BXF7_9BACT|nr:inorganic phosphate transporter [Mariniphaga anaerophila]SHF47208.1 Phosphate transporter family protein [Mariniphaga anaerophila]
MENIYLIIVVVLFALAISDLVVGVSNDAVNFLNSAFGSKAAPKWLIFLMAGLGVLIGATFSSGMMEVARKGIFHPEMFVFSEIIVIFLAVMITDVILLDMFNTFGMPTSTTVSIVFELLGSAVAVSIVKIQQIGGSLGELSNYINSEKALAIITGILLSVLIAFTIGAIVQYITRLIFTFNYHKNMKYFGSVFGGFAVTAITYFILIKGISGSAFAEIEVLNGQKLGEWVATHTGKLLIYSFVVWVIFIQLLKWLFNIKILKITVLIGTFALAMAFAGNDLVNFIGVPLAGYNSFKAWMAAGATAPDAFSMEMLAGKVGTPTYMLLISGLVMISTLIFSKKAQSVVNTSLDLSRQNEGNERFNSNMVARVIVRSSTSFQKNLKKIVPASLTDKIQSRFEPVEAASVNPDAPSFDKIRASVNLLVASILIAIGTSYKLPLSTTYVTFMVAMGTSLSDRAWGRDSAVYRISGVFTVIGGWFLTAIIAFTVAAIVAWIISVGGMIMIVVFVGIAVTMVVRTHILFKKRSAKDAIEEDDTITEKDETEKVMEKCRKQVVKYVNTANQVYSDSIGSFLSEDRSKLKESLSLKDTLNKKSKKQKNKVLSTISKIEEDVDSGHFYVQIVDYQRELAHSLNFLVNPLYEHVNNNHKPFVQSQIDEFSKLVMEISKFFDFAVNLVKEDKFECTNDLIKQRDEILVLLEGMEITQIKRIKAREINTRNSVLFFNTISETKNMLLHAINLIKAHRDFIMVTQEASKLK